jgi:hypothetical protein
VSWAKLRGVVGASIGALVVWTGWIAPAQAQPRGPSAAAAPVKRLHEDGLQAAKQRRWEQAYSLLTRAWEQERLWQVAEGLGRTEVELGKYRDAAEHLTIFLRETRDIATVSAEERAEAERLLSLARAQVVALSILVEPAGADVFVDGVLVGKAPLADPVFVVPGRRSVEARREGYRVVGDTRDEAAGWTERLELRMVSMTISEATPISKPPPQPRGWRGADTGVVIGGTLATLAALGVGTGFAVEANRTVEQGHSRQWALEANTSFWSFVGAGALAAGTIAHGATAARRGRVNVGVSPTSRGAALVVSHEW